MNRLCFLPRSLCYSSFEDAIEFFSPCCVSLTDPVLMFSYSHIYSLPVIFQALAQLQLIDYIGEQTALLIKVSFFLLPRCLCTV